MKERFFLLLGISITLIYTGCKSDGNCGIPSREEMYPCRESEIVELTIGLNANTIFSNSQIIEIPSYSYINPDESASELGSVITINGDNSIDSLVGVSYCCDKLSLIDKHPLKPQFEWISVESELVAGAIFSDKIKLSLDGGRIENVDDIVWTWNSGMESGIVSGGKTIVEFDDGKDVSGGDILDSTSQLQPNRTYFFGVWAWDDSGTKIVSSSRAIPFIVEPEPILAREIISIKQLEGFWKLYMATRQSDGADLTSIFPIEEIDVFVDCGDSEDSEGLSAFVSVKPGNIDNTIMGEIYGDILFGTTLFSRLRIKCENAFTGIVSVDGEEVEVIFKAM